VRGRRALRGEQRLHPSIAGSKDYVRLFSFFNPFSHIVNRSETVIALELVLVRRF
jgi:hypothetical protein